MSFALFVSLILACGASEPGPATSEPAAPTALKARTDVDVAALASALEQGAVVVDVRTDSEWASGHVPGAIHVPIDALSPEHPAIAKLPRDQPVYFICAVGGRSKRAADDMARAGFEAVNVLGGTQAWLQSGRPVE